MIPKPVYLPERLLLDRNLSKSAKLLWACRLLNLGRSGCGVCRDTYRKAMAQLRAGGWLSGNTGGRRVFIPSDLLLDRQVGTQARLLYAILQLTCGFGHDSGQFTFTQLCAQTGISRNALKGAVAKLAQFGWLQITRTTKFAPLCFTLNRSAHRWREKEAEDAVRRFRFAPSQSEGVMQALLSGLVDSHEFVEHARPGFLGNPDTGYELEFDRYYLPYVGPDGRLVPGVAFEYQGPQHDHTTERFPSPEALRRQQQRDRYKADICRQKGIKLVTVYVGDLSLKGMMPKIEGLLPLRNLDGHQPLVSCLERLCREHRARIERALPPLICKSS